MTINVTNTMIINVTNTMIVTILMDKLNPGLAILPQPGQWAYRDKVNTLKHLLKVHGSEY